MAKRRTKDNGGRIFRLILNMVMRLRQLITELDRPNFIDLRNLLDTAGYQPIGVQGEYAEIFAKPGQPFVLKLFSTLDHAYLNYLQLVMTHRNRHFPVLRSRPWRINDEYWAVRLERLAPLDAGTNQQLSIAETYKNAYRWLHRYEQQKYRHNDQTRRNFDYIVATRQTLAEYERAYPELTLALRLIVDMAVKKHLELDMHDDNFLRRGKTLVIIDPVMIRTDDQTGKDIILGKFPQPELPLPGRRLPSAGSVPHNDMVSHELVDRQDDNKQLSFPRFDD